MCVFSNLLLLERFDEGPRESLVKTHFLLFGFLCFYILVVFYKFRNSFPLFKLDLIKLFFELDSEKTSLEFFEKQNLTKQI